MAPAQGSGPVRESGTSPGRLADSRRAFDAAAGTYPTSAADNPILWRFRERLLQAVVDGLPAGAQLLDLGCGPGVDAKILAERGFRVVAIDWSEAMVGAASRRAAASGLQDRIEVRRLGLHELGALDGPMVRAAYSDLGPLNCADDLRPVARALAALIEPGGRLVASVMGRCCPWEIAWHLAKGRVRRAFTRFSRRAVPVPFGDHVVWTRYYWPGEFGRVFADAGFDVVSTRSLGLFLPPPPLAGFAGRHPTLTAALGWLDDRLGTWPLARSAGDHFLMVMRRR